LSSEILPQGLRLGNHLPDAILDRLSLIVLFALLDGVFALLLVLLNQELALFNFLFQAVYVVLLVGIVGFDGFDVLTIFNVPEDVLMLIYHIKDLLLLSGR
jgi:hypothetical protein